MRLSLILSLFFFKLSPVNFGKMDKFALSKSLSANSQCRLVHQYNTIILISPPIFINYSSFMFSKQLQQQHIVVVTSDKTKHTSSWQLEEELNKLDSYTMLENILLMYYYRVAWQGGHIRWIQRLCWFIDERVLSSVSLWSSVLSFLNWLEKPQL